METAKLNITNVSDDTSNVNHFTCRINQFKPERGLPANHKQKLVFDDDNHSRAFRARAFWITHSLNGITRTEAVKSDKHAALCRLLKDIDADHHLNLNS